MNVVRPSLHAEPETACSLEALFAAVLRGEAPAWPPAIASDEVMAAAAVHGVDVLIAQRVASLERWPNDVRTRLVRVGRDACIVEALREREIVRVLAALDHVNVDALLVKGTGLAYTLYSAPELRPRIDTDILVRPDQVESAIDVLEEAGYSRAAQNTGHLVSHQRAMVRRDNHAVWHALDLHWKVANPHVFANLLTFEELWAEAIAAPSLGPHARTVAPTHALLIATIHLAAHHAHHFRLIWSYDIHLMCGTLSPGQFDSVVTMAKARGLAHVCSWGLHTARRWFDTSVSETVLAELDAVDAGSEEPARFLTGSVSKLATLQSDLRALPTWAARARLLKEHAFPPAEYMFRSYRTSRRSLLPALYVHRMVTGGWRWLRQA